MSIRERDRSRPYLLRYDVQPATPEGDAHNLLLAGDAMAAKIEEEHTPSTTAFGRTRRPLCDTCGYIWPCPTRQAADHWREVTG